MAENDKTLNLFTTRVRQLILQYNQMKKENEELYAMVDARDEEIKQLKSKIGQSELDYQSLKTAKMLEISDGDIDAAKRRIAGLIREVNKCITLISGK